MDKVKGYVGRLFAGLITLALGMAPVTGAEAAVYNSETPGSVLIFPKFDITPGNRTLIRIQNASDLANQGTVEIYVRYYYVCPSCDSNGRLKKLTAKQALLIDVKRDAPACQQGYLVAWVERPFPQERISHNYLLGDATIIRGADRNSYDAIAIQSVKSQGTVLPGSALRFDGVTDYAQLPTASYFDFTATNTDPVGVVRAQSMLTLFTLDVNSGQPNPITNVDLSCYDDKENPFSASTELHCWMEVPLTVIDSRFHAGALGSRHGWCEVQPAVGEDMPILGLIGEETYSSTGSLRSTTARELSHDSKGMNNQVTFIP